jgi:sorting nexin-29
MKKGFQQAGRKLYVICPIHKKGDVQNCENSRGITLVNTAYKVLSIVLYGRLKPHANRIIGQYQCGFREGVSTVDQIHTLRQSIEKNIGISNRNPSSVYKLQNSV